MVLYLQCLVFRSYNVNLLQLHSWGLTDHQNFVNFMYILLSYVLAHMYFKQYVLIYQSCSWYDTIHYCGCVQNYINSVAIKPRESDHFSKYLGGCNWFTIIACKCQKCSCSHVAYSLMQANKILKTMNLWMICWLWKP